MNHCHQFITIEPMVKNVKIDGNANRMSRLAIHDFYMGKT